MVDSSAVQWLPFDKYTNKKYKAYMIEDYMYIYNAEGLEYINVRGVFEDPEAVAKFANCDQGNKCYDDSTTDFPIPMDMLNTINKGILSGELSLLASTKSDTTNDRMHRWRSGRLLSCQGRVPGSIPVDVTELFHVKCQGSQV